MTTISKLIDIVDKLETKFFVDIGASCYTGASESEILLEKRWRGIMFECDPNKYPIQKSNMMDKDVIVIPTKVTPDNILNILKENNVPDGFYLTLDIDGYDYFVLDKILSNYKPQLIVSEINEKIPPNIKFTVKYKEDYFWDGTHFYGYSILMLDDLLKKYGYEINTLDFNNIVLIPGTQKENIIDVYNNGYLYREDRLTKFYYNLDFEPIYEMDKEEQIKFINDKFEKNIDNYTIE
jgi:hypothetical protein